LILLWLNVKEYIPAFDSVK